RIGTFGETLRIIAISPKKDLNTMFFDKLKLFFRCLEHIGARKPRDYSVANPLYADNIFLRGRKHRARIAKMGEEMTADYRSDTVHLGQCNLVKQAHLGLANIPYLFCI